MTTNPMPRTGGLLAQLMAKKNLATTVAELPSGSTLTPAMEKKANALVEKILEDSDVITSGVTAEEHEQLERARHFDRIESGREDSDSSVRSDAGYDSPRRNYVGYKIPEESDCGLWNPDIVLDDSQVAAVDALKDKQYGCLIGAAGTGKTTVQKYLLKEVIYREDSGFEIRHMMDGSGLNIAFVAFTGMAVQVMKSNLPAWMHGCCKTIHGLLEFEPEEYFNDKTGKDSRIFMPQRNALRKLDIDFLLIDEASMVGLDLWMQILAALKPTCRIIMTGDLNQLPPIIGQPIFAYALSNWHVSELTKVHRQKEPGANRIVELAHQVLNGETGLHFDVLKGNPDWRVIYQELELNPEKASKQVINILNQLRQRPVNPNDPDGRKLYEPHLDRIMTAGNGYDLSTTSSMVQQYPLNERLSLLIEPPTPEHPRIKIDAGRVERKFSVGNRVMCTKNEPPSKEGRITNGSAGNIINIYRNLQYKGDPLMFGDEVEVEDYIKTQVLSALSNQQPVGHGLTPGELSAMEFELELDEEDLEFEKEEAKADKSGIASHSVVVKYDTGEERTYTSMAAVESIQLAYASTVAKCQGSQFDTAIIICHQAEKMQLSREWLYTAITRGAKRVIILGTDYAVRYAISRQKIKGRTLQEKIQRYQELLNGTAKNAFGGKVRIKIPLRIEDYEPGGVKFEQEGISNYGA